MLIAALELGGTKTIAAVSRDPTKALAQIRLATRGADETLADAEAFFARASAEHGPIAGLGIASFGPLDLDTASPGWGRVRGTVKPGWSGADLAGRLGRALGCSVAIDTDVNAAALAEARLGAGKGCDPLVYLTVGTGIGGGLVVGGTPVQGLMHPEMGHIPLCRHADDGFPGCCSYHGDCAEGLASGRSIGARFGTSLNQLAPNHPFRAVLADYLGQLCATIVLIASPRRIVLGGGVMGRGEARGKLLRAVGVATRRWLGGYVAAPALEAPGFLVSPAFDDSGLVGAFLLPHEQGAGLLQRPGP